MKTPILVSGLAALCALVPMVAQAAPTCSRLTPPSALFSFNDAQPPIIARFLPGQRFDLQATFQADAGQTITGVTFRINNAVVNKTVDISTGTIGATASDKFATGTPANSFNAVLRAHSVTAPGIHTFTATATQTDGTTVSATGNFEVVRAPGIGSVKNVIIMIGDGMGAAHRTAARIMSKGVMMGKANAPLNMDTFPFTGMVQTASLNSIITDSAPGAACYSTGNKFFNNQQGVFPDDTNDAFDNPRVELIGEFLARKRGKSLGIVTTSDVFDATPGAFGSHTSNRGAGAGISDGYLDEMVPNANLAVLLGGGRKWFLPSTTAGSARTAALDAVLTTELKTAWGITAAAVADTTRDLIADFVAAGFTYAADKNELLTAKNNPATTKLLGLFALSNMNVTLDKIGNRRGTASPDVAAQFGFPNQPMLDEMTDAALKVLAKDQQGFVLMVEGASIDKQAHNMDTERWILDTIEFDRAVGVAKTFAAARRDTLIVITADHECSGAAIIGASLVTNAELVTRSTAGTGATALRTGVVGTYESAGFPVYSNAPDGYPVTTEIDKRMLIGYGGNADRTEDWRVNPYPLTDSQQPSVVNQAGAPSTPSARDAVGAFTITGQVTGSTAVHTASDIPLSAFGRGAQNFSGYYDNTDVFFKIMSLVGVR